MKKVKQPKIDQGRYLIYWKLSYRRRFIRDLWTAPAILLLLFLPKDFTILGMDLKLILILLFFGWGLQAAYNFWKWKSETTWSM